MSNVKGLTSKHTFVCHSICLNVMPFFFDVTNLLPFWRIFDVMVEILTS